jgi:hypothetical protein
MRYPTMITIRPMMDEQSMHETGAISFLEYEVKVHELGAIEYTLLEGQHVSRTMYNRLSMGNSEPRNVEPC